MSREFERRPEPRQQAIRRAFERAAPTYDGAAHIQRAAATRLLAFSAARLPSRPVRRILDAGCGTGQALPQLDERFPGALRLALDFAPAMLARAHKTAPQALALCADIEHLPLAAGMVDLYWSSLAVQWCNLARALAETARVLAPGGMAWISTLGQQTLFELRLAFAAVDDTPRVIDFAADEDWHAAAHAAGLEILALGHASLSTFALDLRTLLADIKAIGAHAVGAGGGRRTLSRRDWQTVQATYETFRRSDGSLPASYDLVLIVLENSGKTCLETGVSFR
jgi:malonyl-CoA O-methyltransferase